MRGGSRRCTSPTSCNRGSWRARRAAAARRPPPTGASASRRPGTRSKRTSLSHKLSDFDYDLPADRIAQEPLPDRAASRLLVLGRATGAITHRRFSDIAELIPAADVLAINTAAGIP